LAPFCRANARARACLIARRAPAHADRAWTHV
jgi:hypothetical protein